MQNLLTFTPFSTKNNGSSQRFRRWNDPNPNHDHTMARAKRPIPQLSDSDKERFFAKISTVPTETGCLEWTASKSKYGYGMFNAGGEPTLAHRISYFCHYREDPVGCCVLHACDNPACCNPYHLSKGTHADNSRDMVAKGRSASGIKNGAYTKPERRPCGESHYRAKLNASDVLAIRADTRKQVVIAAEYGVDQPTISDIKRGKLWKSVA
jgi:hypothetical protein